MKKHNLSEPVQGTFYGFAIISAEKDYRLCYLINKHTGLRLEKAVPVSIFNKKFTEKVTAEVFVHTSEEDGARIWLIRNRQEGGYLLPAVKQADYFFVMHEQGKTAAMEDLRNRLSEIQNIQSTFVLQREYLQNINIE